MILYLFLSLFLGICSLQAAEENKFQVITPSEGSSRASTPFSFPVGSSGRQSNSTLMKFFFQRPNTPVSQAPSPRPFSRQEEFITINFPSKENIAVVVAVRPACSKATADEKVTDEKRAAYTGSVDEDRAADKGTMVSIV